MIQRLFYELNRGLSWPTELSYNYLSASNKGVMFLFTDIFLPLSSLRLLIPPLRLVSAAMWQVAQRTDIMDYGKLEEFVSLVTDTVPDLLTCRQRAQLLLSLRTRVS